jgi:hypothetical protein
MRRTSTRARRIEAKEAAICLGHGGLPFEWRVQIAKTLDHLWLRRDMSMKGESLAHQDPITSLHLAKPRMPVLETVRRHLPGRSARPTKLLQTVGRCFIEDDNGPPYLATAFPGLEVIIMHYRSKPALPAIEM